MVPRCERPECSQPAAVRWGFDPRRLLVWLDRPEDDGSIDHGLCTTHAQRLRPPRGWWLDDRRLAQPALFPGFAPKTEATGAIDPSGPARPVEEFDPSSDEHPDDSAGSVTRGKGRRRKRREAARQRTQTAQAGTDEPLPFTPDPGAP